MQFTAGLPVRGPADFNDLMRGGQLEQIAVDRLVARVPSVGCAANLDPLHNSYVDVCRGRESMEKCLARSRAE